MEEIVNEILRELQKLEYSGIFADSTIFMNIKGKRIEIHVITGYSGTLYPITVPITTYRSKVIERIPKREEILLH